MNDAVTEMDKSLHLKGEESTKRCMISQLFTNFINYLHSACFHTGQPRDDQLYFLRSTEIKWKSRVSKTNFLGNILLLI